MNSVSSALQLVLFPIGAGGFGGGVGVGGRAGMPTSHVLPQAHAVGFRIARLRSQPLQPTFV